MQEKIRAFIEKAREGQGAGVPLEAGTPLFETGALDSMSFILLLSFIEKTFGVTIDMSEIAMEHFDTLSKITAVVQRKIEKKDK